MICRHAPLLGALLLALDVTMAVVVLAVVSGLRFGSDWTEAWTSMFTHPSAPGLLYIGGLVVALWANGLYRLRGRWSGMSDAVAVLRSVAELAIAAFALLFLLKMPEVSRLFLLILFPAQALVTITTRALVRALFSRLRRMGRNSQNVLIAGSGSLALSFARELALRPTLGLRVIGYVNGDRPNSSLPWPYLGPIGSVRQVMHDHVVDEVALCMDVAAWDTIEEIVQMAEEEGKVVRIPLAAPGLALAHRVIEDLDGLLVMSFVRGPDRQIALAVKRGIDVVGALTVMILSSPIWLLAAVLIKLGDGGPVFFRQVRVGLHGRRFRVIKFRTMVPDAEERLGGIAHRNELDGPIFKLTDDPRITRVGRPLRRTSIDELPQLLNVLRGQMSLVGPRPPLPDEVAGYDAWHRRRLSMKPGMTGLWQVEARREPSFDRWVEKDLEYIDRWSLRLDLWIALRTIPAMLRLDGR